jgi:acyl-CoA synthetase (AMP-forming)/AMP-acid ligase II
MDFNAADLFERVAGHLPEREAVICGETRATYEQLDRRSNQVARYLQSLGVVKGDHVGIYAYNRIEWVEAMLGCYKISAVPINVNYRYVGMNCFIYSMTPTSRPSFSKQSLASV